MYVKKIENISKMATTKRSWKLQEFVAHNANVNCLALGHKSGRVLVTGGDDMKVNLWAVGKQSCFMNLSGHTTPIDCVQFNHTEELVCAGSRAGALKVWDLEATRLVRTLTGHRDSIRCVDFHPYGDFLTSGSSDCSIKLWDTRKKGCICTFPGHKAKVNSIKFSPDGQWIASGSDDTLIKVWDLRVGKVIKEFNEHSSAVTCVEFHPHEFLLATGSMDRSIHFFDLENFSVVSSEKELGYIRCLCYNPDGECLFTGVRDYLKVVGWEPSRMYDSVPVNWCQVSDISTAQNQLVGASFHLTNVTVYVVDLKQVQPFGGTPMESSITKIQSPFTPGQSIRKSFSRERPVALRNKATLDVKTIEESTSGTDPEEDSTADIIKHKNYNYKDIFRANRSLNRTPPPLPEPEPFAEPNDFDPPQLLGMHDNHHHHHHEPPESLEALSLQSLDMDNIEYLKPSQQDALASTPYSRSQSNLEHTFVSRTAKQEQQHQQQDNYTVKVSTMNNQNQKQLQLPKFNLQRQSSCKDVPEKRDIPKINIKHSASDANLSKINSNLGPRTASRKNSFSKPSRNSSVSNVSKIPNLATPRNADKPVPIKALPIHSPAASPPVDIFVQPPRPADKVAADESPREEYIPVALDRPVGLDLDDFLPKNHRSHNLPNEPNMTEAEVLGVLMRGHDPVQSVLLTRERNLKVVYAQYRSKDMKAAVETALTFSDLAIVIDLLGIINCKSNLWNLDLCVILLPKIHELLQSKFETYMTTGCDSLKLILRHFGPVIKTNIQSPVGSFGVDLSREERYNKSCKCHELLLNIRSYLLKKQTLPGQLGNTFRELHILMQTALG